MPYIGGDTKHKFLNQLNKLVSERLPKKQAAAVNGFAQLHYASVPMEDVQGQRIEDIYAGLIVAWRFLQKHGPGEIKINVFNPNLEEHGWQSPHTVIQILMPEIPFIIDSIRMVLNSREMTIHLIQEALLRVARNKRGELEQILNGEPGSEDAGREMSLHVEVDRHSSEEELGELREGLLTVLQDVLVVNQDFEPMKKRCEEAIAEIRDSKAPLGPEEIEEVAQFMEWLLGGQFTFLGYDELRFGTVRKRRMLDPVQESALGVRRKKIALRDRLYVDQLTPDVQAFLASPKLITVTKASTRSRVHRPAYPDYVSIRQFNEQGEIVSERRFLGLFTARFYHTHLDEIPLVRRKVAELIRRSELDSESHIGRAFAQILHNYPREEILETSADTLFENVTGILNMQERRMVRLFLHRDPYNKFVTALIYCPRDLYNTELRLKYQHILLDAVGGLDSDFTTQLSESVLARVYFVMRVEPDQEHGVDVRALEEQIKLVSRSWLDDLNIALNETFGEEQGNRLYRQYRNAFPAGYREDFSARAAAGDIQHIQEMDVAANLGMSFYRAVEEEGGMLRFKLFQIDELVPLSEVLPILEHLGLCVMAEYPYDVCLEDGRVIWIRDFSLRYRYSEDVDLHRVKSKFLESFSEVWKGNAEDDSFNRLVLGGGFSWREVTVFRAYAHYNKQIRFQLSEAYAAEALGRHEEIARCLLDYFNQLFDPARKVSKSDRAKEADLMRLALLQMLEGVESLDDDRILRRYLELMDATLRTNFFQPDADGAIKPYISFKIDPRAIAEIPRPRPMYEIFVYSPRVEGVHLRGGKVARGGLRWSDRLEDFRTEVLGLVKAQQVKNAVIVPVGAKGGFVCKRSPLGGTREELLKEGIACYQTFIRALLDVTDNYLDGKVVAPQAVVRRDEDDYYLVVAADKGTATFSDIANAISEEYGHWLGDAFASGGSAGYDHKGMGITAKGAWVSVQRHFRELGIDVQRQPFTVVGVGDMGGDVFGNGMLLSDQIKLCAAFNHMHIFVDPDPDPAISFAERQRLFELPRSTWDDYDRKLMSKGGGIFNRSAKSVDISPQMKQRFDIEADRLTPNQLINAILKAPIDLLWNGGIGTYVKAREETDLDVGDKANDSIRINGGELRARVVGEGGNLGMTQLGRVEYCLNGGGRCNTDFIDNAAGVDCSDHEVNIKILLNEVVAQGDMTGKQRNKLLASMTDEVSELVLQNNYSQTGALSVALAEVNSRMEEYRRFMLAMESAGKLDRALEYLPDEEEFQQRRATQQGLSRAELSVLISYCKADLKEQLIHSALPDDDYLRAALETAFPGTLIKRYRDEMYTHQLSREIVATQIANDICNRMGITFVSRMTDSTGTKPSHVAKAFVASRDIFGIEALWDEIEALDHKVDSEVQQEMIVQLIRLVRRASRWLLRNRGTGMNVAAVVSEFAPGISEISGFIEDMLLGVHAESFASKSSYLIGRGVPEPLARSIARLAPMYNGLGMIEASAQSGADLRRVCEAFFKMGDCLQLHWYSRQITDMTVDNHWQALAREAFRDDLDFQRRSLTVGLLTMDQAPKQIDACVTTWVKRYKPLVDRWRSMLDGMRGQEVLDFAMFSVAGRELVDLAQGTVQALGPVAAVEARPAAKKAASRRRTGKSSPASKAASAEKKKPATRSAARKKPAKTAKSRKASTRK